MGLEYGGIDLAITMTPLDVWMSLSLREWRHLWDLWLNQHITIQDSANDLLTVKLSLYYATFFSADSIMFAAESLRHKELDKRPN